MTKGRKLLIGAGAAIIVLMLMTACFSVGVYLGTHGLTGDGLSLRQPGGQAAPAAGGGDGPGGPQPVPGGGRPPDLLGRIRQVMAEGLHLATTEGPRTVAIDSATGVQALDGAEGSLEDLQPGLMVAVFGTRVNGGNVLLAELIVVVPQQPPRAPP